MAPRAPPAAFKPFHSYASGSSYPSLFTPFPTPPPHALCLQISMEDAALYDRNASLARSVTSGSANSGGEESALVSEGGIEAAAAAAAAGVGGGAATTAPSSRIHLVTERGDIELFRGTVNTCASANGIRLVDESTPIFLPPNASGGGGGGVGGGMGGLPPPPPLPPPPTIPLEQFLVSGMPGQPAPSPASLRNPEAMQALHLQDLLPAVVVWGPFAGQERVRYAAPLLLSAFQRAEGERRGNYWEYLRGGREGAEGCSHLLVAPVARVQALCIRT